MEKTVAAFEARRRFGKILQEVSGRGSHFVIERNGEPVAAIVPLRVHEEWERRRREFFARMEEAAARSNLSPEEADALAEESVRAVREANPE
jgi:prevent-host-death family protein